MNNVVAEKSTARVTPIWDCTLSTLRYWHVDAERADDRLTEQAIYAILWFFGTGRAFTGIRRALEHMNKTTLRAYVARVAKGMQDQARVKRGTEHSIVTGDLSNAVLAAALGCSDVATAEQLCCNHPYGVRFTLGR
jgi:hypothetical protein